MGLCKIEATVTECDKKRFVASDGHGVRYSLDNNSFVGIKDIFPKAGTRIDIFFTDDCLYAEEKML